MKTHWYLRLFWLSDTSAKRSVFSCLLALCLSFITLAPHAAASPTERMEYQIKTAFIYNFIAFTQWPNMTDNTITLCIYGKNNFGDEIKKLQNRPVNNRQIKVVKIDNPETLKNCQAIFFSKSVSNHLSTILKRLQNKPTLTLADSVNAAPLGVAISMNVVNEKIVFEINLGYVRQSGLDISSKLLQLAAYVYQ